MIRTRRAIRTVLMSLALLVPLPISVGHAADSSDVIQAIQQKLADFGYNVGKPDGKAGKKTVAAVTQFQEEFRLPVDGDVSEATAAQLQIPLYVTEAAGQIYVLPDQINGISLELRSRSHAELINYLYELSQRNVSKINMDGANAKTVVFVLDSDLKQGDIVTTQFENIRLNLPKYYENFYYEVEEDTPTEPLVIVNTVEAGWELQFTHRMFLNGVLVAEKRTRAAK